MTQEETSKTLFRQFNRTATRRGALRTGKIHVKSGKTPVIFLFPAGVKRRILATRHLSHAFFSIFATFFPRMSSRPEKPGVRTTLFRRAKSRIAEAIKFYSR